MIEATAVGNKQEFTASESNSDALQDREESKGNMRQDSAEYPSRSSSPDSCNNVTAAMLKIHHQTNGSAIGAYDMLTIDKAYVIASLKRELEALKMRVTTLQQENTFLQEQLEEIVQKNLEKPSLAPSPRVFF